MRRWPAATIEAGPNPATGEVKTMAKALIRAILGFADRVRGIGGDSYVQAVAVPNGASVATRAYSLCDSGPEAVEQWAVARLADGSLDAPIYRSVLAQLAAAVDEDSVDVSLAVSRVGGASDEELRDQLDTLAERLPELPGSTARAALALRRSGADTADLTRLLRLTGRQARTVVAVEAH
jgi:hypothetical protein